MDESHFIDMMRAIQPHVSGRPKRSVELLLQSADLLHSVHQYQEPELSACDTSQDSIDFEALLMDLQGVCNPAEAELVNLILNFFRSRKIYSAYRIASQQGQYMQQMSSEKTEPDIQMEADKAKEPLPQKPPSNFLNLMENEAIQSLLSPAQKENLNQIGTLMQAMS